jgi:predicted PurR-regulated permease PerM
MITLYLLSAGTVLIIAAIVMVYLLSRIVDLLERIGAVLERTYSPEGEVRRPGDEAPTRQGQ